MHSARTAAQTRAARFGRDRGGHHHRLGHLSGAQPGGAQPAFGAVDHRGLDLHRRALVLRRAGLRGTRRHDSGHRRPVRLSARSLRTAVRIPLRLDLLLRGDLGRHRVARHHVRHLPGILRAADAGALEGGRGGADRRRDAGELSRRAHGRGRAEDLHADEGAGGWRSWWRRRSWARAHAAPAAGGLRPPP